MSLVSAVKDSLGAKVTLKLSVVVLVLTGVAAAVITSHQTRKLEEESIQKARLAAILGARYYGETLEQAIDGGVLTVADAFDRTYVPIKGYDWAGSPKFHTRYDALTDALMIPFLDATVADEDFTFAIGVDDNGYLPTHATRFMQPLTGDPAKDHHLNRAKRMANYPVGLAAAHNLEQSLVQDYSREFSAEKIWDVSSPIFVKGKHWGAFRIGASKARIRDHERVLMGILIGIFGVLMVVTAGSMYLVMRSAMRPVLRLTEAAEQISLGEALDTPIKPESTDEIGKLTKTIDRLRLSTRAAMARLGH